jgi:HEAT repeat protein
MIESFAHAHRLESALMWTAAGLALSMLAVVAMGRTIHVLQLARHRRHARRFEPLVRHALAGNDEAIRDLAVRPSRHRLVVLRMMIEPLIDDQQQERIANTRSVAQQIQLIPLADRYLRSWRWWRRALALRALGLTQVRERTAAIVTALDDPHPDVRAAALDALVDLQDPASLPAVVVRMHDPSLHVGRRVAALAAFGDQCEPWLLDLSEIDPAHRVNYARALEICGTARSRPTLCRWTRDSRPEVRAAAFEALAHVGLDHDAASLAVEALNSDDESVRAMAASALQGWTGGNGAAAHLALRLDDAWPVAIRAARALQSMGVDGAAALQTQAGRTDLAGLLARQMLWEVASRC